MLARLFAGHNEFVCVNVRKHDFTISRRDLRPRFAGIPSLKTEGAGNAGCLLHPRSRVQEWG